MLLQSCDDERASQELGSADSSFLDYLPDSNNSIIPWQQDRTASPELFGDAIDFDDSSLPDSHRCSPVPTTQTLVRTFEQSWKEPSFQDFGADNSFQGFISYSPRCTFPWQQDQTASPGISSDANSQPYIPKRQRVRPLMLQAVVMAIEAAKRIAQSPLFSEGWTLQRRNKINPSLEDIKQQFGNKREDAAKNLGVSVSTLKRICRKYRINLWPYCKENSSKGSYKGMGVRSGLGTSSLAQAAHSAKGFAPTVPASSSQKRIRSSPQIATLGTTSTEDAMVKSTDPIIHEIDEQSDDGQTLQQLIHWSRPLRMLPLEREKYSGFRKSQTSIVDTESKFTDFEEQAREVEGNKGESAGGEDGVEKEEDSVEGELSRGNSRVREELQEDHDEVQCGEHVEVEMQWAELPENVTDLPANQPSVHNVNILSLAKEDAIPSKPAFVPSMATPERAPNPAYHVSFSATPLSLSAHPVTMTSADHTVPANFPLQHAVGAASAAADPACSGQASNNVTRQSHLHEISKKSQFLEFEVSSNAFPLLTQIQQRFPETFTSFKIKRSEWAVSMLGNLAEFVKSVADTKVHETSEETVRAMHGSLDDLENMGFSLPWLKARLEDGTKVKKHNENNRTYEYSANALEKINGDIKKLDEDYDRASSKLRTAKEKLEVDTAKAKAGLEASERDLPLSLSMCDSLLKDIIM